MKKKTQVILLTIFLVLAIAAGILVFVYPSFTYVEPERPYLVAEGVLVNTKLYLENNGELYVSVEFLNNTYDLCILSEDDKKSISFTNTSGNFHYNTGDSDKLVEQNGVIYISKKLIQSSFPIDFVSYEGKAFGMYDKRKERRFLEVSERSIVRLSASRFSPRVKILSPGEKLEFVALGFAGFIKITMPDGSQGFITEKSTKFGGVISKLPDTIKIERISAGTDGRINLTWDYMSTPRKSMENYIKPDGVNILSPTWFHLKNSEGEIESDASVQYVDWAASHGIKVWALFDNSFNPEITSSVLRNYDVRSKVIEKIVNLAVDYSIHGVNLDFENIHFRDKAHLTQFVRELCVKLHEKGLILSQDITFVSTNEYYSRVYDRERLSRSVDYLVAMAYDEHWSSSPKAGPVASPDWVRSGLERLLEVIPANMLIHGMPLYTRLWSESKNPDHPDSVKVKSKAYSMISINKILAENKAEITVDENYGINYAEFKSGEILNRVWLEDELSLEKRLNITKELGLAGVATWRKGFEKEGIWEFIADGLK